MLNPTLIASLYVLIPAVLLLLAPLLYSVPVLVYYQAEDRYVDASAAPTMAIRYAAISEYLTGAPLTYVLTLRASLVERCTLRIAGLPYRASRYALSLA